MPILDKNNNELIKKYKAYVDGSKYGRLTQSLEWTKVKNNWENEIIYIEDENSNIVASMLILIQKLPIRPYTLMYAPRGPVCDIYDVELVKKLINEASDLAKKYNACALKFDPAFRFDEKIMSMYKEAGFKCIGRITDSDMVIQPAFDAILDIDEKTEDELLKSFSEKTRYNVRLAGRKGVEVHYSREERDLKTFYELYEITCKRDKIGCRPYDYFKRMLEAFDEQHLRIYVCTHEEDKLSGAIAINYGPEMFYLYGASSNVKRNLMPNYLMQWEMIKWGLEKKSKIYNFGGIVHMDKDNGLYKFKTGFCREEGIFEYVGEIDYVYNKFIYFLYTKVLPIYKKIKRKIRNLKNR